VNQDIEQFQRSCGFLTQWVLTPEQALQNQMPRLVFSHVPKTGGTTLETILAKNYRLSDVLHLNAPEFKRYPDILKLKKNPPRFICGHHPLHSSLYQHLPAAPVFHLTLLRDPLSRVLSYYNYVSHKEDHPLHQQACDLGLADFIESGTSPELNNGQARRFSGYLHQSPPDDDTLFTIAQDALQGCFSLVGTTACFDETLLLLHQFLGLSDLFYRRRNQSPQSLSIDDISEGEREVIESMNQADIQLYQAIESNLDVLIDKYLTSHELAEFCGANSQNHQWIPKT